MKHNISFLLFGLLVCLFASCDTDDLEKDIDALTERVENIEARVLSLNDNMNIVRVMLDGNKTITSWSQDGDVYTLTLSNGETYTLTPGVVGGNFPPISISEAGTWVINGTDTGKRAVATDGTDATVTPQFKIENNAWFVSYDNTASWEQLANGLPIGTNTGKNPIEKAAVNGSNFVITMNGVEYSIPIVENLICAIDRDALAESMENGVWMVAQGAASVFKVAVNANADDVVRVKAPVEWQVAQGAVADGVVDVTVTAPLGSSECVMVVELIRGAYTVTDQLKVKTVTDSYYADYLAGFDITIGDVVVNKYDYPGAKLLEDGETVSTTGCYFVKNEATVTLSAINGVTLISEKKSGFNSKVQTVKRNVAITGNLLCKGIELTSTDSGANIFSLGGGDADIEKVYFENCNIILPNGMNFAYFSGGTGIKQLSMNSCYISLPPAESRNFLNLGTKRYGVIEFKNNVCYCNVENRYTNFNFIMGNASIDVIEVENNTFINQAVWGGRLVNRDAGSDWKIKNNLFWYANEKTGSTVNALINQIPTGVTFNADNFSGNQVCTSLSATAYTWKVFYNNPPAGFVNALQVATETTPFEAGSVPHEGIYTLTPEYAALGAGAVIK